MIAPGLLAFIFTLFFVLCVISIKAVETHYVSYKNCRVYEIKPTTDVHLKVLQKFEGNEKVLYFDLPRTLNFEIGVLVFPQLVPEFETTLKEIGVTYELIHEDVDKVIESEKVYSLNRKKQLTWDAYYNYDIIVAYLRKMENRYPKEAKVIQGGRTYEGRNITGLKIKRGNDPDQPVVFIESGIHAREWITPATTTYFIEQLLTNNDTEIQKLAEKFEWHIFPSTNPDGYQYSFTVDRLWRKTRSYNFFTSFGTDPNRNYDYQWNSVSRNPYSEIFPGSAPFSEIETRTLSNYVANLDNLIAYIAFHSTAQMFLVPYSTSVQHFNNYDDLVAMGRNAIARAKKVNGETYRGPATASEILYAVSGGSMDWVKHTLDVPIVYTIELRGTNFHWPPKRIPEQGDEVVQMMVGIFEAAEGMGYLSRKTKGKNSGGQF